MFIDILYNSRQRKKYDEWKEKENQAIYDLGQILVCDRAQAKFVIDQLGRKAYYISNFDDIIDFIKRNIQPNGDEPAQPTAPCGSNAGGWRR